LIRFRLLPVVSLALSGLFSWAFYTRYWIWRDCFNELGRCYDPVGQVVLLEQSGLIWGSMTAIALAATVVLWRRRQ
jgi:hypothetical protein